MSELEVEFFVVCPPIPEGSMCVGRGGHMYHQNAKDLKTYRKALAKVADTYHKDIFSENNEMGYEVTIIFYLEKPASVKRPFPTVRGTGDLDKLTRAVLDALTRTVDKKSKKVTVEGLWADDAQVVRIKATKYYCDKEHPQESTFVKVRRVLRPLAMLDDEAGKSLDNDI